MLRACCEVCGLTGQGPSILFVSSVPGIVVGHLSPVASHCCAMAVEVNTMRAWLRERLECVEIAVQCGANLLSRERDATCRDPRFVSRNVCESQPAHPHTCP